MDNHQANINRSRLLFRLGHLNRRWRNVLDTEFQSSGLTDAAWHDVRQKDLTASLGIEGPSLVRLIDSLIAKGLMERSEYVRGRRAKLLRLTPEGHDRCKP